MNLSQKNAAFLFCLSLSGSMAFAQKRPFSVIDLQPHIGLSWQSTLFNPILKFSVPEIGNVATTPYIFWERNTQGLGLDLGFSASSNISRHSYIGFKINARLRYDYIYGGSDANTRYHKMTYAFLLDMNNSLVYTLKNDNGRELMGEIGITANQFGKVVAFEMTDPNYGEYYIIQNLQYPSVNFGLGYETIKLGERCNVMTQLFFNYIPGGHPAYETGDFMTLGLKAYLRFKPGLAVLRK